MEAFEPLINLLVLMSTLSVAAERVANAIKLGAMDLRERKTSVREEKERERRIAQKALAVSIVLALVLKADFFEILEHLNAPWDTLGWARSVEVAKSASQIAQSVGGMVVTGISLGFGSKFWHEVLDVVSSARDSFRRVGG